MNILSIDPSTRAMGWCLASIASRSDPLKYFEAGTIHPIGNEIMWQVADAWASIKTLIVTYSGGKIDELVIEWPCFYGGAKGQMAAQQGYTINLAAIAMYIAGKSGVHHNRIRLYTAPQWKGQVPKAKTLALFERAFGVRKAKRYDNNAIDAVMLLVHHLRVSF